MSTRRSGLLLPLFSCPSTASWGIGDIGDLVALAAWLVAAGQRVLQLLPINEMAPTQQSPYSAISSMAIDPLYIRVADVPDFDAAGGEASLAAADRDALADARRAPRVDYAAVRRLKRAALRASFDHFIDSEWRPDTSRARALRAFVDAQSWWLDDYSLFRAIHTREGERPWPEWPIELQRREPEAIDRARHDLATDVLFYQYLQWIAGGQWQRAREQARGIAVFGDLPFMVDGDSADVWRHQEDFRFDATVGAPPDAFSATGQDWGMPLYDWDAMLADDFQWLRERARRSADLFDGYRIDHLVGFYRTYGRPKDGGAGFFTPEDEASQLVLGERVLDVFRGAGAEVTAEDLGTVPDFVRESLARARVPGFRVFRWERRWHEPGQPFRDPSQYPPQSVATSGTHDTETMIEWWERAPLSDRGMVSSLPTIQHISGGLDLATADYATSVRDVLLESLFASGSDLVVLPVQDAFGWRDRVNEPASTRPDNWTYRLPWPVDRLDEVREAGERRARLREWAQQYGRCIGKR